MGEILVVDDDVQIRQLLQDVLEFEGFDIRAAPDGLSALKALAERRPDCVLLDVMMPGMSGLDVLAAVRSDPRLDGLPVVMLSAASDDRTTWAGWSSGANCYLTKPFDVAEVIGWVHRLAGSPSSPSIPAQPAG